MLPTATEQLKAAVPLFRESIATRRVDIKILILQTNNWSSGQVTTPIKLPNSNSLLFLSPVLEKVVLL